MANPWDTGEIREGIQVKTQREKGWLDPFVLFNHLG
jgi:hypothetical protein